MRGNEITSVGLRFLVVIVGNGWGCKYGEEEKEKIKAMKGLLKSTRRRPHPSKGTRKSSRRGLQKAAKGLKIKYPPLAGT